MEQESSALPTGTITESKSTQPPSRRLDVDVRSRDAFELLKLGEAIVNVKADLRNLRLEKEDLRFERDRYKAAATDYQTKLVRALDDLERARSFREEAEQLRRDIVMLAREFQERLAQDQNVAQTDLNDRLRKSEVAVQKQIGAQTAAADARLRKIVESLKAEHEVTMQAQIAVSNVRLHESVASLEAEHQSLLRDEVIELANECKEKLAREKLKVEKGRWWRP